MTLPGDTTTYRDPYDRRRVLHAPDLLQQFNAAGVLESAGVLEPADVHAAVAAGRLLGEADPSVLLAAALAVRGTRLGHILVHLPTVQETIVLEEREPGGIEALPWPPPAVWLAAVAASPLCGSGEPSRPLVLTGEHLYLQRYWRYERDLAHALRERAKEAPLPMDAWQARFNQIAAAPDARDPDQRQAMTRALTQRLTVVTGGPGTGKTETVARLLAVLVAAAADAKRTLPAIAVAAPTGKAAAVLKGKLQAAAQTLPLPDEASAHLRRVECSTIHRLLGQGTRRSPLGHGQPHLLPHDFVVVDEMSMVPLSLAARLVLAIRPAAQLVLVGDAHQLVSIEAGSVLRDIVESAETPTATGPIRDHVVVLRTDHRLRRDRTKREEEDEEYQRKKNIKDLREAILRGNSETAIQVLRAGQNGVAFLEVTEEKHKKMAQCRERPVEQLTAWLKGEFPDLAEALAEQAMALHRLASKPDEDGALRQLDVLGFLCAHRAGIYGAQTWGSVVEHLVSDKIPALKQRPTTGSSGDEVWYPGRPVMVTVNDYGLRLFNGDKGVAVGADKALRVFFGEPRAAGRPRERFGPAELENIQTVHAMTIHKSQGSEFDRVVVLLPYASSRLPNKSSRFPNKPSRLLTRELLYTAVTRAKEHLTVVGTTKAIETAIDRPAQRASGLQELLWGEPAGEEDAARGA